MERSLSSEEWAFLLKNGYVRLPGAFQKLLPTLEAATNELLQQFPYGFSDPKYYTNTIAQPLTRETARPDGRILMPYAGFKNLDILLPLANPYLHELLERVVGKDFYLSNTWYQEVPPGTARLAYHKDTRGSISFNILLDEIGPGMGSTCMVPGSHINTPPASYCMSNIHSAHPAEVDLTGSPGDLVLFSTETWHARSKHSGGYPTRRLFYNFYSRSSRDTTTWADVVDPQIIERARTTLPPQYGHMFDVDPRRTRQLAFVGGSSLKSWAFKRSSSDTLIRDIFYAAYAYGRPSANPRHPAMKLPFTSLLTESGPFDAVDYFSKLKLIPTLKNAASVCRKKMQQTVQRIGRTLSTNAPSPGPKLPKGPVPR